MVGSISSHPWLVIAVLFLTAGLLVGAAVCLLTLSSRQGKERYVFLSDIAELRECFSDGRKKRRQPWALVYIGLSLHKMKSTHTQSEAGKLYDFIKQELMLQTYHQDSENRIARFDGKNFLLLTQKDETDFARMVDASMQSLQQYTTREGIIHPPELHFGYYRAESGDVSFEKAVKRAKQTCNYAENNGKLSYVYNYEMLRNAEQVEKLEKAIQTAIVQDDFFLEFQPFIDGATGQVVGGEALSRLNSDERGIITPQLFLQAVASVGIYGKFDYYIFEKCCAWAACRIEEKRNIRYISCNFSRYTMSTSDFAERIIEIADRHGVPSRMIAVEVTEEEREVEIPTLIRNLEILHQRGFAVFLDDFGKGFTSFADLQNYPIDVVKIDKEILDHAATGKGRVIFESMIQMAKRLGCTVLCEGVETEEQAQLVKSTGCDLVQGFYHYRTLSADMFNALLPVTGERALTEEFLGARAGGQDAAPPLTAGI